MMAQKSLGLNLGQNTSGLGMGLKQQQTGLGMGLGQQQTGLGMGLGQQQTGLGMGLGQQHTSLGLGTNTGLKTSIGGGLGQQSGLAIGLGQPQSGLGMGLKTSTSGLGMGLGQQQTGLGMGLGQQSGLGMGLGQQQTGLANRTSTGMGIGSTGMGIGSTGMGLGSTGMGLGSTGMGLGSTGMGLGSTGMGLGNSMRAGMGMGLNNTASTGLGGLSLAGTQKGVTQGIFTQSSLTQQPSHQQLLNSQLMISAITMPALFGDERDLTIQKFNQLEAYSGTGKGLTSYNGHPQLVEFTPQNPFARFKTICYNQMPSSKNENGLVGLHFNKPDSALMSQKESLEKSLQTIINNTAVQVVIDSIKPLPDNCAEVTIYILEQSTIGSHRRVLATNTCMYLQNQQRMSQLASVGVTGIYPKTGIGEDELKLYLFTPPNGITSQVWEQSKRENPNSEKYIPVAIVGSSELLKRIKHQKQEYHQHDQRLKLISDEIIALNQKRQTSLSKVAEHRRKLNDLSHRLLKVMVVQEKLRKSGWSIQPIEEELRIRLDSLCRELDSPKKIKGRLNEILSQLRMHGHQSSSSATTGGTSNAEKTVLMDTAVSDDINEHLFQQQGALTEMVKILKQDFKDLSLLETGLKELAYE